MYEPHQPMNGFSIWAAVIALPTIVGVVILVQVDNHQVNNEEATTIFTPTLYRLAGADQPCTRTASDPTTLVIIAGGANQSVE